MAAWTQLFGMISFELFGHFHSVVDDVDPVFERALLEMGRLLGFPPPRAGPAPTEVTDGGREGDRDGVGHGAGVPPDGEDEVWFLV